MVIVAEARVFKNDGATRFHSRFVTFTRGDQLLGRHLVDVLKVVAMCDPNLTSFARQVDRKAARHRIAIIGVAGLTGSGGHGVSHCVHTKLRPSFAPKIGRRLRTVDYAQHFGDFLDAGRDTSMRLADAKDGMALAAERNVSVYMTRLVEIDRDRTCDTTDHFAPADDGRNPLLIDRIL